LLCFYQIVIPEVKHATPFFKHFWKCSLFQGSCQLFGALFQRFQEVLPVTFWRHFSKVFGSAPFSKRHVNFSQKLINVCTSLPFFKGVLLIGFPKFPFPRFASLSPMLRPFSKGGSIVHQKILWRFAETFLWSIPNVEALFILVPLSGSGAATP